MSGFRTKIDLGYNRQGIQRVETLTNLSGTTVFGTEYSGLTSGVDLTTVVPISTIVNVITTFSGDSFQTIYDFPDGRMVVAAEDLQVITDITSGTTQNVVGFEPSESIEIDGNTVNLAYTGSSYDLTVTEMGTDGFVGWTGSAISTNVLFLSGGTLDYQDRTIWVDVKGITKTERLIITDDLDTNNSVLKALVKQPDGDIVERDINYYHDQGLPSNVWDIPHNLGKLPSITVIDTANSIVEGAIEYIDNNNVQITFNSAFSGSATCN